MPSWTSAAGGSIPQREGYRRQSTLVSSLSLLDRTLLSTTAPHAGLTLLSLLLPSPTPSSTLILSSSSSSFVILPAASFFHSLIHFYFRIFSLVLLSAFTVFCVLLLLLRGRNRFDFFFAYLCSHIPNLTFFKC